MRVRPASAGIERTDQARTHIGGNAVASWRSRDARRARSRQGAQEERFSTPSTSRPARRPLELVAKHPQEGRDRRLCGSRASWA
ncbi:MAG: hypothetical protein MZV63_46595 [Marinilabiliales bacterium]|nr:hypothetical protein [Marinilabiliales bacterium]